jgi:hypothetical protein
MVDGWAREKEWAREGKEGETFVTQYTFFFISFSPSFFFFSSLVFIIIHHPFHFLFRPVSFFCDEYSSGNFMASKWRHGLA